MTGRPTDTAQVQKDSPSARSPDQRARLRHAAERATAADAAQSHAVGELLDLGSVVAEEVADRRAAGAAVDVPGADDAVAAPVADDAAVAHVSLRTEARDAVLTVNDEGTGIPPDQRDLLLEPFTRADASRAHRTSGAGLGPAVMRSLAEAHGGAVVIGDAPSDGARVTVRLLLFAARTARDARMDTAS